jgi:hypothetical protein
VFGKSFDLIIIEENEQYAVVNHANGLESLYISINFNWERSNRTAWIIPIPAGPENITVKIPGGYPGFSGSEVSESGKNNLDNAIYRFSFTYILSVIIPFPAFFLMTVMYSQLGGAHEGYSVHERTEMYGLTAETVSATSGDGFYKYITDSGLDFKEGVIPQMDELISKNYSFVVVWISKSDEIIRHPGIIIEFPTERGYYPMILTSVYGENVVPINLIIIGHKIPKLNKEIEKYSEVSYYIDGSVDYKYEIDDVAPDGILPVGFWDFVHNIRTGWDGKFTLVKIESKANNFKEDIWIDSKIPFKVEYSIFISKTFNEENNLGYMVILYILYSFILSIFLGLAFLKPNKNEIPIYIILGFSNIIGILGLIIWTIFIGKFRKYPYVNQEKFLIAYLIIFPFSIILFFFTFLIPIIVF